MKFEQRQNQSIGSQAYARELNQGGESSSNQGDQSWHGQKLMQTLEKLGPKKLAGRRKEAQRLLRENGATHNFFGSTDDSRSWQFDPIPLIIDSDDWTRVEAGLVQRAQLLNLILDDIYGSRELIKKGLLPPELIYAHKGFLLPCVGLPPSGGRHLNLYSANLAQGKDGRFWVLEDHAQPPYGSGYAVENRIVMTRSFARLFQDFQVHRLAMYFRALKKQLAHLDPNNQSDPRIVILTPGPEHSLYFEHAYLAAYLGYPLVQGGDLIVRDGCVWLKSVGGLRQIDVLLNRLDDEFCDPLELRGDSLFGVPGLLEVVRRGNVATANSIGCGIIKNPALLAFLPGISRYFLGEELLLPSVATWWCGQPRECKFVLDNLNKLIIKPIYPIPGLPEMIPGELDKAQICVWRDRILANPHLYVGQEMSSLSTVPAFVTDRIEQRPCVLSTYLTAHDQSYVAMSGGLTRINENEGSLLVLKDGGCSKDTWILTPEPAKQVNLWLQAQPNQLIEPRLGSLPSRTAENLFWAGRYSERSEATARLLRSILIKLREFKEFRDPDDRRGLNHLLQALTHVTLTYPGFVGEGSEAKLDDPRVELMSLASDSRRSGSLRSSLRGFGYSAYTVRDILPEDAWRIVDNIQQNWSPKFSVSLIGSGRLQDSINQLLLQLSAFSGLNNDNMARETDWLMLKIGRSLERALTLIALLRTTLVPYHKPSMEAQMFETVLSTSNSLITYRRRYRSFMQLPTILELLLMDENYPRALRCQLSQLHKMVAELPHDQPSEQALGDEVLIVEALAELNNMDLKALSQLSNDGKSYPALEIFLSSQKKRLEKLSETLMQLYFSPSLVPQRLGSVQQEKAS
ncbi:circularly permuted type 2 ATP-grasp protein [uncultured Desulfuromusa sp.]|uniref:circularly permuted type 2 ATP-grasp protein n=1 Tax=uncultured Desulfuromusa sp. TaxID=219183 RepID=UPI002AA7769C|nr:circularly permuted type 2 ATP-grasp protein [uncultured Desulfuromusa sp.]